MRSSTRTRWGDEKNRFETPESDKEPAIKAQTVPLPLLPATWMIWSG